uniref:Uncharacterized protein n=1 Tax=Anguilla anguilla TaxID=7936 RepID=A0A0E9QPN5_ANGAN
MYAVARNPHNFHKPAVTFFFTIAQAGNFSSIFRAFNYQTFVNRDAQFHSLSMTFNVFLLDW